MSTTSSKAHRITQAQARRLWLRAQRLDQRAPFGAGAEATRRAIGHLGYVQIDTINVIERCHHHILYSRIPAYQRADLRQALSIDKTVFEYWTHALAYIPLEHMRFFVSAMKQRANVPSRWFDVVAKKDLRKVLTLIRDNGPLTIRDIDDDVLVEKDHAWASRKPSKRALQLAFFTGALTISARSGMLKTYDLLTRHFGWDKLPKPAPEREITTYLLDRALRSQAIISLEFSVLRRCQAQACDACLDRSTGAPQGTGARCHRGRGKGCPLGAAADAG